MSVEIKNNVLQVEGEWLFLYGGNHAPFDYHCGKRTISEATVESFKINIDERTRFCKKNNIPYVHVIFPSKPSVKRDLLKKYFPDFTCYHNAFLGQQSVLYPEEVLLEKDALFYKTDTHNSPAGSWEILKNIVSHLNVRLGNGPEYVRKEKLGDLAKMAEISELEAYDHFIGLEERQYAGFDQSNRSGLKGNTGEIRIIRNPLAMHDKRVLIFADSFINDNMNEQLSWLFTEVLYIRSANFLYEIIDFVQPDYIISGQAERYLPTVKNDSDRDFFFAQYQINDLVDRNKLPRGFNRALQAMLSNKSSKQYQSWIHDVDEYMLGKLFASDGN